LRRHRAGDPVSAAPVAAASVADDPAAAASAADDPAAAASAADDPAAAAAAWLASAWDESSGDWWGSSGSGAGSSSSGAASAWTGSPWQHKVFSKVCRWLSEHSSMVIRTSVVRVSVAAMLLASMGRHRAQRRIRLFLAPRQHSVALMFVSGLLWSGRFGLGSKTLAQDPRCQPGNHHCLMDAQTRAVSEC
jgi:hypothetical protein